MKDKIFSEMTNQEFQIIASSIINNYLKVSKIISHGSVYVPELDEVIDLDSFMKLDKKDGKIIRK